MTLPLRFPRIAAVAAVALAATMLSSCTTVSTLVSLANPDASPTESALPDVPPTGLVNLDVGDCYIDSALVDSNADTDPVVACTEPHNGEIYFTITLEGEEYPLKETLAEQGVTGCKAAFADFVGLEFELSHLDFRYLYPTDTSWSNGDREIDCVVFDPSTGLTTGTLAGSER